MLCHLLVEEEVSMTLGLKGSSCTKLWDYLAGESDFEVEHGKVEIFQPILSPMKCGKKL